MLLPIKEVEANMSLKPTDPLVTSFGRTVYSNYCASCHGANLEWASQKT